MRSGNLLQPMFGLMLVILLLAGCVGAQAEPTATSLPATVTPTPAPIPVPATATPTAEPTVKVTKDVAYTTPLQPGVLAFEVGSGVPEFGSVQTLDVYAPTEPGPWPVVVFVPGINEWKELYADLSQAIAEQGAVVFAVNWPVVYPIYAAQENGVRYRESHETLVCAVRFAHAMASDYGGDPAWVTLAGLAMGGAYGAHCSSRG